MDLMVLYFLDDGIEYFDVLIVVVVIMDIGNEVINVILVECLFVVNICFNDVYSGESLIEWM